MRSDATVYETMIYVIVLHRCDRIGKDVRSLRALTPAWREQSEKMKQHDFEEIRFGQLKYALSGSRMAAAYPISGLINVVYASLRRFDGPYFSLCFKKPNERLAYAKMMLIG